MLDHLPKNVWNQPKLRWLDPCAGTGNFFDAVLPRLMEGLKDAIPNSQARKNHILHNMLTMVELNPVNIRRLKYKYSDSTTIIHGDFLDNTVIDDSKQIYDIILANPPYQSPKHESYTGSAGNRTLWDLFIKKAMSICRHGSFLGWITPSNWRRPEHPLFPILYDKILYIHIYDKSAGKKIFGAQTRFDLYVISSEGYSQKPIPLLVDEHGVSHHNKIIPNNWPFYPNFLYEKIKSILTNSKNNDTPLNILNGTPTGVPLDVSRATLPINQLKSADIFDVRSNSNVHRCKNNGQRATESPDKFGIQVIYDSSMYDARVLTKRPTHIHKFPVIHTLTTKGMGIRYAKHKSDKQFGIPKVILNFNEKQYPVNDYDGKYGMSQLSFGIPIHTKTEGERMIQCMETPVFQDMIKATKWGSFQTDYRMFKYFRKDFVNILCPYTKNVSTRRLPSVKHNRTQKK
jgi:hypothetical protein